MDYKASGVDIDAGNEVVRRIRSLARGTFTSGVLSEIGSFGGLFRLGDAGGDDAVLVASADGVGTKLRVAFMTGVHTSIGVDLVNHCVNDILVQGASPLFFLDYLATGRLNPDVAVQVVEGLAGACRANGCALLGGETAEMPGFYADGEYDVAGFIVGVVPRRHLIDGQAIAPGDVLIGLPSSGLHTNGYSLARRIAFDIAGLSVDAVVPSLGRSIGEALLVPHRSYLSVVRPLIGDRGQASPSSRAWRTSPAAALPTTCRACCRRARTRRSIARRGSRRRSFSGCSRQAACRTPTCCAPSTWGSGSSSRARPTASRAHRRAGRDRRARCRSHRADSRRWRGRQV